MEQKSSKRTVPPLHCAFIAMGLVLMAGWGRSASTLAMLPSAAAAEVVQRCGSQPAKPEYLLQLLSEERRLQFEDETLQVFAAELDGVAPPEAVAFADHAPDPSEIPAFSALAYQDPKHKRESTLWVFRCVQKRWQLAAEKSYELDEFQARDSVDDTLGFNVVQAERLLTDRDLLRVELVNFRVASYTSRSFDLYALRSNNLTPVFSCETVSSATIGPSRYGRSTRRTIELLTEKLPAQIRVWMRTEWSPGVESEDPDYKELAERELKDPPDGRPASESRTEVYSYDGSKFTTERPACDE